MQHLDLTLPTPEENLACDEALLDWAEEGRSGEVLRFWEARQPFVVVGYSNKVHDEVFPEACRACGVPILRRCSGGGTVVQGPGVLNYTLVLRIDETGPLGTITGANRFIMERQRLAVEKLVHRPVSVSGHTDLAMDERKFSGNAQRRRRQFLIFHGTFLLKLDAALMEQLLPYPSRDPDYRRGRAHTEFLTVLRVPADSLKTGLRTAWNASEPWDAMPDDRIARLVRERYARDEWNLKF
ncbi:MAG: lipoate--protein ligase family protein [Verrucomicrobiota bacterium]